jgi:hypothetical protein
VDVARSRDATSYRPGFPIIGVSNGNPRREVSCVMYRFKIEVVLGSGFLETFR